MEKLTARSKEVVTAFGRAPRGWVDDGGELERERVRVRDIQVTVYQNEELGVSTDMGEYDGALRGIDNGD